MAEESGEKFGKCPVDVNLSADAVSRTFASEVLCEEEYGLGVGDPSIGWWSNNWVNTPGMGPGVDDAEVTEDLDDPFLFIDNVF